MKKLVSLVLLLLASPVSAQSVADRIKLIPPEEWVYQALTVVDVVQTMKALDDPCDCFREANPLYGSNPSDFQLVATTLAFNAVHAYVVLRMVESDTPDWIVKTLIYSSIVVRSGVIYHNFKIGVRF